jgi:hypothetical protein
LAKRKIARVTENAYDYLSRLPKKTIRKTKRDALTPAVPRRHSRGNLDFCDACDPAFASLTTRASLDARHFSRFRAKLRNDEKAASADTTADGVIPPSSPARRACWLGA